jgi:ribonuclease P protein component
VQRFDRRARLLNPAQFKRVFAEGRRFRATGLTAVAAINQAGESRLGLALARKVLPLAVSRNRIKRVARESFRTVRAVLPSCDVVLLANPSAAHSDNAALRADLSSIWTRISRQWPSC